MSSARKDRLEAKLAALGASTLQEATSLQAASKSRVARWQHFAALTGSPVALVTNASLAPGPSVLAPFIRRLSLLVSAAVELLPPTLGPVG